MIFELWGEQYSNEQEIIDAGCYVIYYYCRDVRGRWQDIENLMVFDSGYGYWYAVDVIRGRYEPELETLYMKHSGWYHVRRYIEKLVRYGNV